MNFSSIKQQLMLPQFVNGMAEQVLNALMRQSENIETYLRPLIGKVLSLQFKQGGRWFLAFSKQRVDLLAEYAGETDCSVITDASILLQQPKKSELSALINRQEIVLHGDLQVLQDTVALFEHLEKDPETLLAPYIGDIAAYSLVTGAKKIQQQMKQQWQRSERHLGERLTEEWQLIAPSLALVNFYDQVADLAQDAQRLEEKIERLTGKI